MFLSFKDGGEDGTKYVCDMFFYIYYNMQINPRSSERLDAPPTGFQLVAGVNQDGTCTIPNFDPMGYMQVSIDQVTGNTMVNLVY